MSRITDYAIGYLPLITASAGGALGAHSAMRENKLKKDTFKSELTKLKRFEDEAENSYQSRVKRSIAGKKRHYEQQAKDNVLSGVSSGALNGLILGSLARSFLRLSKPSSKFHKREYGGGNYRRSGSSGHYGTYAGGAAKSQEARDFASQLNKIKTKVDAKKIYRKSALKTHPDKPGGSGDAFKNIKNEWDEFTRSGRFDKLAFFRLVRKRSMMEELEKISGVAGFGSDYE